MIEHIYKIEKLTFLTNYILNENLNIKLDSNFRYLKIIQDGNFANSKFIDEQIPMSINNDIDFVKLEINFKYPSKKHEITFFFIDNSNGTINEFKDTYNEEFHFMNGFNNLISQSLLKSGKV